MIHTFRSVNLGNIGKAVGLGPDGLETVVFVPVYARNNQLPTINVGIVLEDGAWSAGALSLRMAADPNGEWVALFTPKTISETDYITQVSDADFPYLGVEVTTANSGTALATITISITDGGNNGS
jgi:hypothetical protein